MQEIKEKLINTTEKPGCYIMSNSFGHVIYVGKAKNLKKRLASYFNRIHNYKTQVLVGEIADFKTIVTENELEALILEINLIKKYKPKYNVLLKDDKTYPHIELVLKDGPMLRIIRSKKPRSKNSLLFGPYPNVYAARETVNVLNRIYPLRKCQPLKKDYCLYYHIGQCLGYCKNKVDDEIIEAMLKEVSSFLNGHDDAIILKLEEKMKKASKEMKYEEAIELREVLKSIKTTLSKQAIELSSKHDFDLVASYLENNYLSVVIFNIRSGKLFSTKSDVFPIYSDEAEALIEYIVSYYEKAKHPKELVVSQEMDNKLLSDYLNIKVKSYQRGRIKQLFDLALENAKVNLEEKEAKIKTKDEFRNQALASLKEIFNKEIKRIEAFDNSHLFGSFYVASMVVFDYLQANKNAYRKYKLTLDKSDDLMAFREVLYRRYHKVLMGEDEACDLIIVDGGELQVKVAKEVLASLNLNIEILGLKKDAKHKTSSLIDKNLNEIKLKDNKLFVYLARIQEEAHRFAITYHRNLKSKGLLHSFLDLVPGIGPKKREVLLRNYSSFKRLKEASLEELEDLLDKKAAEKLHEELKELK